LKHDIVVLANRARRGRATHLPIPEFFMQSLLSQLHSVAAGLRPPAGFSGTDSALSKWFFTLPRV